MGGNHSGQLIVMGWLLAICVPSAAQADERLSDCQAERFTARSLYDWSTKQNVFFVKSSGFIADRTFMAISVADGPSAPAKALASWLTIAEECPLQLTVAGKSEPKTMRVIRDAFGIIGKVDLRALEFTFVGSASAAEKVEQWVRAVGATFHARTKLEE